MLLCTEVVSASCRITPVPLRASVVIVVMHLHPSALGVPGVHPVSAEKRFQILKLKFTAYPLMKLKFKGVFELLSVRAVHWYACHLPKVKLQKLRSEKHAFGLPVERRKEGSQGP